tara:strand:+ start:161 stop:709 length:549 start_codon:yes stop_codon:yes gene_type:complete
MNTLNKILFLILLLSTSLAKSQNRIFEKDSIIFERDGFNSGFELKLYENNKFEFQFTIVGCLVITTIDENGNEVTDGPSVDTEKYSGTFKVEKEKLKLSFNDDKEHFFLETEYFVLPTKRSTYLISKTDLKCLKEWKYEYEEPFPEYILKSNEGGICELFSSKKKFLIEFETKYIESKLKKR